MPKHRVYKSLNDTLTVETGVVPVRIFIERRGDCSARIGKKAVNIRIPAHAPAAEKMKLIEQMKDWARGYLAGHPTLEILGGTRRYADGDVLRMGGAEFLLRIFERDAPKSRGRLLGRVIAIDLSTRASHAEQSRHLSKIIARCVGAHRQPELARRIIELNNEHFNCSIRQITFKDMATRWGSCSSAGSINISSRLLFAPDDVLDYVCIHEIAHIKEPNHSPKFWALVEKAMPDYKQKRRWLKDHEHECRF